ncbi:hypothetical protein SAMN05421780_101539 [Flexibacter flexilis DSM 6793]|uniref:Uncharacterized protein n=1 Tax=Flexibacter flexilis DSM 6793 TaxID=927664 RepID=A0A1I1DYV4_9BACT|nr:hypothetical protein [Flexibacter flexilis]SFB80081.1 hypothetical protein SAMN05421780_101539 [Flexibacter flexilis DSM 6793]
MREVFKVAEFDSQGKLRLLMQEYASYNEAVLAIEIMPTGVYQVQKVFVKSCDYERSDSTN